MLTMKCDMAGAAAVLAAVVTAAELELPVRVDAWCCMAENMPSGSAQRPSDVLTMRNGTTCEVLNTDAEGRLVLADGIARASEESPDVIIDVATLTGACVVALGTRTFGVFATDDELAERVVSAANRTGEPAWRMPLLAENAGEAQVEGRRRRPLVHRDRRRRLHGGDLLVAVRDRSDPLGAPRHRRARPTSTRRPDTSRPAAPGWPFARWWS